MSLIKVLSEPSCRLPRGALARVIVPHVLYVIATEAGKEYLLAKDVGIFWVLARVFACGALAGVAREGLTGEIRKKSGAIEVSDFLTGDLHLTLPYLLLSGLRLGHHRFCCSYSNFA